MIKTPARSEPQVGLSLSSSARRRVARLVDILDGLMLLEGSRRCARSRPGRGLAVGEGSLLEEGARVTNNR